MKYLRGFDECDGGLVCVCVYVRPADLIKVCFNEHGLSNKNNGRLLRARLTVCCVSVCVCAAAMPLKSVTGVCETTADNNGPTLVQVKLNDRELSRGRWVLLSESFRIFVNTTSVCVWHRCVKIRRANVVLEWLGFVD